MKKTGSNSLRLAAGWLMVSGCLLLVSCQGYRQGKAEKSAVAMIQAYEREIAPLDKGIAIAEYEAARGGSPYVYERLSGLREERALAMSSREHFKTVARWHKDKTFQDPYLSRQIGRIYYDALMCQADTGTLRRMARLETYLYEQVIRFLSEPSGGAETVNPARPDASKRPEVSRRPDASKRPDASRRAELSKQPVVPSVEALLKDSIVAMVHCRNALARQAGFEDYYAYQLARMDLDCDSLAGWFHTFDTITETSFLHLKDEIALVLAERYGVSVAELQRGYYQKTFFQDIFNLYDIGQSRSYENKNVANLTAGFFESIGLYIRDILRYSDLRPRQGKAPFTHCYDLDHRGDVRLLSSLEPNMESMCELLCQGGIALYRENISSTLPYLLKNMDYSVLCEGVGRMFRRMPFNVNWLQGMGLMYMPKDARRARLESYMNLHAQQLIFCRWGLVMYHFERALYQDPDQDLNQLWRDLERKYQLLSGSTGEAQDGDGWITKWHIVLRPCFYQNYLLGSAVACHLNAYVCDSILQTPDYWTPDYMATEEVGTFLKNKIFWHGDAYPWYEILERATGRPFSLQYYAQWLVGSEPYAEWRAEEDAAERARRQKYLSGKYN